MRAPVLAMLVLAGCGDQLTGADAGGADAAAGFGLVRLRYFVDEPDRPVGWPVYFQDADGALVSAQHTHDDGSANVFMMSGGYVTLVAPFQGITRIWTYAGVKAGDELELDLRSPLAAAGSVTLLMTIPKDPLASFYQLQTSCGPGNITGAEQSQVPVTLPQCDSSADMLVLARGGGGAVVDALLQADVPIAIPGPIALVGPYLPPGDSTVTTINIPPTTSQVSATHGTVGRRELLYTQRLQYVLPSTAGSLTFSLPQGKTGTVVDAIDTTPGVDTMHVVDWRDAGEHTVIDLAMRLPDDLDIPHFDLVTRTLTWTEESGGLSPDTVLASLQVQQLAGQFLEWEIIAPRGASPTIRFPVLPDRRLDLGATTVITPGLLINALVEGGYDSARQLVLGRLPDRAWPMEGPTGHAVYQVASFGLD